MTIWSFGCEEKLVKEMARVSWKFITVMALITLAMVLQIIATRYLQTAYKNGLRYGNKSACEAYLLRASSAGLDAPAPSPSPRWGWLRRRRCRERRVDWTTVAQEYSNSDENSGEELLKYFH